MRRWILTFVFALAGCVPAGEAESPTAPLPLPASAPASAPATATATATAPDSDPAPDSESAPDSDPAPAPIVAPPVVTTCVPPRRTETAPRLREGLIYSRVGAQALALDLALPASSGPHPIVLVFHGGGWSAGERAHVRDDIATLAGLGYAGAAIDYRLVDGSRGTSPAAVADARCAVRYLRRRADELGLDAERMGALGYSAGGQIALMLGTASDVAGLDGGCSDTGTSPAIRAAIGYFPPVDMRPEAEFSRAADQVITRFLGVTRRRDPRAAALASPLVHVDGGDAATLLVHGTEDNVVPVGQSRMMRAALARVGVPVTFVEIPGARHGFRLFGRGARVRPGTCTSLAFLQATLGG